MAKGKVTPKRLTLAWVSSWSFIRFLGTVPEGTGSEDVSVEDHDPRSVTVGTLEEFIADYIESKKDSGYDD